MFSFSHHFNELDSVDCSHKATLSSNPFCKQVLSLALCPVMGLSRPGVGAYGA